MLFTRYIYATRESMSGGFPVGSIVVEIDDGSMYADVYYLHDTTTNYRISIDNAHECERGSLYEVCNCIIETIYDYYVEGCLFADFVSEEFVADEYPSTRSAFYSLLPTTEIVPREILEGERRGTIVINEKDEGRAFRFVVDWPPPFEREY